MEKDFDGWNNLKKNVDFRDGNFICREGNVWWCSIGINIGTEINGKSAAFDRPVVILKKFNKDTFLCVPCTSKIVASPNHVTIHLKDTQMSANISQIRTCSVRRMVNYMGSLEREVFLELVLRVISQIATTSR